jgi:hypothetical protein
MRAPVAWISKRSTSFTGDSSTRASAMRRSSGDHQ